LSDNICARVAVIMVVTFGGVFLLIYILFESLGITEYVWPILFPILAWTFGVMFFVFLVIGIACRTGSGITSDASMVRRTYAQPTYPTYDSPSTGSVYVIPVYCPHCMNKIELDRVEWIGSSDFTCPSCFSTIQAGLRENI
jgi:hypothetical protein